MEHETYKEMLAADALGALDPREADALAGHLRACDECRAEQGELLGVASMLAHTVAPVAPPASLRARVLAQVKPSDAASAVGTSAEDSTNKATDLVTDAARNVLPFTTERGGRPVVPRRWFTASAVAASLLAVALVTLAFLWQRDRARMRADFARLDARTVEMAASAARAQQELEREREANAPLTTPDARFATLAGSKLAPGAQGRVTFDPRTGRALLVASDLPPAPAGYAYQLWFIKGAEPPVPGRVFRPDAAGRGSLRDQAPPQGLAADTFAVTLEPEQGVPAPTGQIYLVGKIS